MSLTLVVELNSQILTGFSAVQLKIIIPTQNDVNDTFWACLRCSWAPPLTYVLDSSLYTHVSIDYCSENGSVIIKTRLTAQLTLLLCCSYVLKRLRLCRGSLLKNKLGRSSDRTSPSMFLFVNYTIWFRRPSPHHTRPI